ncbi:type IV secretion system DNA-binding domain-containing protein [Acidithiobacillus ferrianus]|uniref:Type IV secretion system DNA-binding domain-containing protein n=2 Tax=Acidithiobacillus ferrianus TaxID=2678518 RepID=A0A845U7G2_9PROT|nr:type IV secretion system DNA-binding domain-containing protein [Acidithiobacillus ferrianus]NDU43356.1 type IV secretion system DNA-binding domain-containing protein [Acidithiobacillus ferrianus]
MDTNATPGRKKESFTKGAGAAAFWLWALVMVTSALTSMGMSAAGYDHGTVMMPAYLMAVLIFGLGVYGGRNTQKNGSTKATRWQFLGALWVTATAMSLTLITSQSIGFMMAIGTLFIVHRILLHKKKQAVTDEDDSGGELVRGTRVYDYREQKRKPEKADAQTIIIGGVPIPREAEPSHFLLAGAPGVGKSTVISDMLEVVRNRNERACIYDPAGEFTARFYREGDVILNPLDARSAPWTPWADATSQADYEQIAAGLIPDDERQPFFPQSARALLVTILSEAGSVQELVRYIMSASNEDLISMVEKHGLIGLVGSSQTFSNSRASMTAPTTCLRYLRDPKPGELPFSIREWVTNEKRNEGRWIFLTSRADQRATLRPLLSLFIDTFVTGVMMLPPDRSRRVWLFVDEAPTLQKMPKLVEAMAEGRKFGLCEVVGFQNVAQARERYGKDGAESFLGLPQTQLIMRLPDPDTAKWGSGIVGDRHIIRGVEGESTSAQGGGESTTFQHSTEPAILPAQIQGLPNLEGILRYMGPKEMMTARVKLVRKDRTARTAAYIPTTHDMGVLPGHRSSISTGTAEDAPTVTSADEFKTAGEIDEEVAGHDHDDPFAM